MDWFHNYCCTILFIVLFFITFLFIFLFLNNYFFWLFYGYDNFDFFCSLIPIFFLVFQCFVSIFLLYYLRFSFCDFDLDFKIYGHQWYWTYEYRDFNNVKFDSYLKRFDDLLIGEFRLLDVDNYCIIPSGLNICFLVTSFDVIHSWTLFNLFFKLDAIRGIINSLVFKFPFIGLYYGQCSEICGVNHSFIPIVVESVPYNFFKYWLKIF